MGMDLSKAIDYAIKTNAIEGLYLSEDAAALLERVRTGEITLDEYGEAITLKYKLLGAGEKISADEALEKSRKNKQAKAYAGK